MHKHANAGGVARLQLRCDVIFVLESSEGGLEFMNKKYGFNEDVVLEFMPAADDFSMLIVTGPGPTASTMLSDG